MPERRITADGRILEKQADGSIVEVGSAGQQQGGIYTMPQSPQDIAQEGRANAQLDLSRQAAQRAAAAEARANEAANRSALEWQATHNPDGSPKQVRNFKPIPDSAAKRYEDSISAFANFDRAASGFQDAYAGNAMTGGLENTIQSRFGGFGTPGQSQWWADMNATDNALRNLLFGASLTPGEAAAWERTTVNPSMDPKLIRDNLARRRELARDVLSRRTNFLKANGYDPEAVDALAGEYGQELAAPQQDRRQEDGNLNAMDILRIDTGGLRAGKANATKTVDPIPSGMQQEYMDYLTRNQGNINPDDYAQFRGLLAEKYGFGNNPAQYDGFRQEAQAFNDYYNKGGRTLGGIPGVERQMSTGEQVSNSLMNNWLGAGIANAADGASFGLTSRLAGDKFDMLSDANPASSMIGGAIGAAIGSKGIGRIGASTLGKIGPLSNVGNFGRNMAADAAYGGLYGGVTEGDPLTGAVVGAGASALGQGAGHVVGKGLAEGFTATPTLARLREQGVVPTMGQAFRARAADRGGRSFLAGAEDVVSNTGFLNNLVNGARNRSLEQANTAAYRIAADGAPIDGVGLDALQQVDNVRGQAYNDAAQGVSLPLNEPQFMQQVDAINPGRGADEFGNYMQNKVGRNFGQVPALNGRRLQEALRMLKIDRNQYRGAAATNPAYGDVADAIGQFDNALLGNAARNAPDAIPKLKRANRINRNYEILDDAAGRASSDGGVFTGAHLGQALAKDAGQFSGGRGLTKRAQAPLHQLQQDMVTALPNKVPPTGVNVAPMLALGGAGLYGAGEATDSSTLSTLGLLGMLATPYTKKGQKATDALLFGQRPKPLRDFGKLLLEGKRKGLFGAAAVPLALEYTQ